MSNFQREKVGRRQTQSNAQKKEDNWPPIAPLNTQVSVICTSVEEIVKVVQVDDPSDRDTLESRPKRKLMPSVKLKDFFVYK